MVEGGKGDRLSISLPPTPTSLPPTLFSFSFFSLSHSFFVVMRKLSVIQGMGAMDYVDPVIPSYCSLQGH